MSSPGLWFTTIRIPISQNMSSLVVAIVTGLSRLIPILKRDGLNRLTRCHSGERWSKFLPSLLSYYISVIPHFDGVTFPTNAVAGWYGTGQYGCSTQVPRQHSTEQKRSDSAATLSAHFVSLEKALRCRQKSSTSVPRTRSGPSPNFSDGGKFDCCQISILGASSLCPAPSPPPAEHSSRLQRLLGLGQCASQLECISCYLPEVRKDQQDHSLGLPAPCCC